MAQHDYNLANTTGANFRTDANNALSAIVSLNSGATAPTTTFAYMLWADTAANLLKQRNAANTAWVEVMPLNAKVAAPDIQEFTTNGTWTKPPGCTFVFIKAIGGGGGGGSGRRGASATIRSGGGGGGGSAYNEKLFKASDLPASLTITIGAGGSGAPAVTVDNTSGSMGGVGGSTSARTGNPGTEVFFAPGGGGGGGGSNGTTTVGGDAHLHTSTLTVKGGTHASTDGTWSDFKGGGGGAPYTTTTGRVGLGKGGNGGLGGGGGGCGSSLTTANGGVMSGAGGGSGMTFVSGPTTIYTDSDNGGGGLGAYGGSYPGGTGFSASGSLIGGAGGGGGGLSSLTSAAYPGGSGGLYGAGGGGGGASANGYASGAGGNGSNGFMMIISW